MVALTIINTVFAFDITGIVRDFSNNQPISGARVELLGQFDKDFTASDGSFNLANEPTLKTLQSPGLRISGLEFDAVAGGFIWNENLENVVFSLHDLQGRVLASFNAVQNPGLHFFQIPQLASGLYWLSIKSPSGQHSLKVIASGHSVRVLSKSFEAKEPAAPLAKTTADAGFVLRVSKEGYLPVERSVLNIDNGINVLMAPDPSHFVFDQSQFRSYYLTINQSDWQWLNSNAALKEYVPAQLTFEGKNYGTIGVRFKGQYTLDYCVTNPYSYNCDNKSLKLDFAEYVDSTRVYGLKKLNLQSTLWDMGSKMKDRLGYYLYNKAGIITARAVHAKVYINGSLYGVFTAVESIDGRFTANRFPKDQDGNLYKEVWPDHSNTSVYLEGLRTNDKPEDNPNVSKMLAFAQEIPGVSDANGIQYLAQRMDIPYIARYLAMDKATVNWDGIMGWYCRENQYECATHNNYWYEFQLSNRYVMIPWDMNNLFWDNDPFTDNGVPEWYVQQDNCSTRYSAHSLPVVAPACDPLIGLMGRTLLPYYIQAGEELLDEVFTASDMQLRVQEWANQIADGVAEESSGQSADWNYEVNSFMSSLPSFVSQFRNHLDREAGPYMDAHY
jgi:hypothetical protein